MRRDRRRERYVEHVEGRATGDGPERAERDRVNAALGRAFDENRRRDIFFSCGDKTPPPTPGHLRLPGRARSPPGQSRRERAPGREPGVMGALGANAGRRAPREDERDARVATGPTDPKRHRNEAREGLIDARRASRRGRRLPANAVPTSVIPHSSPPGPCAASPRPPSGRGVTRDAPRRRIAGARTAAATARSRKRIAAVAEVAGQASEAEVGQAQHRARDARRARRVDAARRRVLKDAPKGCVFEILADIPEARAP